MAKTKNLWKVVAVNIKSGKMEEVKFSIDNEDACVQDILGAFVGGDIDDFDGKLVDNKFWTCSKGSGEAWLIDASKEFYDEYRDDELFFYDWTTAKLVPADAKLDAIKAPKVSAKLQKVRKLKNEMQSLFAKMADLACDLNRYHLADALDWSCGRDAEVIREDFAILEEAISSDNKKGNK